MPTSRKRSASSASAARPAAKKPSTRDKIERYADGTRKEYDFSGGGRGKHYARLAEMAESLILLDDDVAKMFPDSRAVNDVLRAIGNAVRKPRRRKAG
jgi:hypothetical protein